MKFNKKYLIWFVFFLIAIWIPFIIKQSLPYSFGFVVAQLLYIIKPELYIKDESEDIDEIKKTIEGWIM